MECMILGEIYTPFFYSKEGYTMKALTIAMICHGINAAYCRSLGDDSQVIWDEAPQWQRDSVLAGVEMHLKNPDATPEDSHNSWLKQKELEGWKYGEVKDVEKKEHPCFLPYSELPQAQRSKDYLFKAVVHLVKSFPEIADHHQLLTELVSTQTQLKQYQATLANSTTANVAAGQAPQGTTIVFDSFKSEHTDNLYGSGVTFVKGQPKTVPKWLADKLLTHPEFKRYQAPQAIEHQEAVTAAANVNSDTVVQQVDRPTEETLDTIERTQQQLEEKEKEQDAVFDTKQMIDQIADKNSLAEYAMKTFNQTIPKNQSLDWMKNKIYELIDQQGLPE